MQLVFLGAVAPYQLFALTLRPAYNTHHPTASHPSYLIYSPLRPRAPNLSRTRDIVHLPVTFLQQLPQQTLQDRPEQLVLAEPQVTLTPLLQEARLRSGAGSSAAERPVRSWTEGLGLGAARARTWPMVRVIRRGVSFMVQVVGWGNGFGGWWGLMGD